MDLKISAIPEKTYTNFTDITGDGTSASAHAINVPGVQDNDNCTIDLVKLSKLIKTYIDNISRTIGTLIASDTTALQAIAAALNNGGGLSGGSEVTQLDLAAVNNRITSLILSLELSTNFPTNYIKLIDSNGRELLYGLPSGYGLSTNYTSTNPLIIKTTDFVLPNFYVEVTSLSYNSTSRLITGVVTVSTLQGSITLQGGTLTLIKVSGSLETSNGAVEIQETSIFSGSITLPDLSLSTPTLYSLSFTINNVVVEGQTVSDVGVTCSINNIALGSRARWILGGTSTTGSGQIYLNSNAS